MTSLTDLLPALTEPFHAHLIDLKPGAMSRTKDRALALAYADVRVYQERLDRVVGPDSWSVTFKICPLGIVCTLAVLGVVKADVGDYPLDYGDTPNENKATTASAQAFKRACAQFGIGRYLYELPRMWADYDAEHKTFVNARDLVHTLYRESGLGALVDNDNVPDRLALQHMPFNNAGQDQHKQQANIAPVTPATDPQLGLLAHLMLQIQQGTDEEAEAAAEAIDTIGDNQGIEALSSLTSRERLRAANLSKTTASRLIKQLKALQEAVAELIG